MAPFMGFVLMCSPLSGGIYSRYFNGPAVLVCYEKKTYRIPSYLLPEALKQGSKQGRCP